MRGKRVVILVDHDDDGEKYAATAARMSLDAGAVDARIVRLATIWPEIPAGGDVADWLDLRDAAEPDALRNELLSLIDAAEVWTPGTRVLWRGELTEIRVAAEGERPQVCLAADVFRVARFDGDLRPTLEAHFARRAKIELPGRTWELAAVTGMDVKHVTVRNQRSRWGSCSANGTISLNWRLVQTPDFVRDYIIYHELMHLREMNHSDRFWARVAEVCPGWQDAERWIKRNGSLIGL
jgi:predicted metal-dependent hydrolase